MPNGRSLSLWKGLFWNIPTPLLLVPSISHATVCSPVFEIRYCVLSFDVSSCPAPEATVWPSTVIISSGFGFPSASHVTVTSSSAAPQRLSNFSILKTRNQSYSREFRKSRKKKSKRFQTIFTYTGPSALRLTNVGSYINSSWLVLTSSVEKVCSS